MFGQNNSYNRLTDKRIDKNIFADLWKNRNQQRVWIYAMASFSVIVTLTILAFLIAKIVLYYTPTAPTSYYRLYFIDLGKKLKSDNPNQYANYDTAQITESYYNNYTIWNLITTGVALFISAYATLNFINSIFKSYQYESFHLIRFRSASSVFISVMMILFLTIILWSRFTGGPASVDGYFLTLDTVEMSISIFFIAAYFILAKHMKTVVSIYFNVYQRELIRLNSGNLQQMIADMNLGRGFGINPENMSRYAAPEAAPTPPPPAATDPYEQNYKKLLDLPRLQVEKIAQELNIYDYKNLPKEELCRKIAYLTTDK